MLTCEEVSVEFLNYLTAKLSSDFNTISRVIKTPTDYSDGERPALFLIEVAHVVEWQTELHKKQTLGYVIELHSQANNSDDIPARIQNLLIQKVIDVIVPQNVRSTHLTLGNKVKWVKIVGEIMKMGGHAQQQTISVIPIEILLTH
jgi:hypothetical protein